MDFSTVCKTTTLTKHVNDITKCPIIKTARHNLALSEFHPTSAENQEII